ncbi:hypothetical protein B5F36_11690 [Anaerofilum sp. An201]|nr:LysM peptidoglycan-binding domain-containing protein [Anaerofilum sp. An201]OUP01851.1 hypothetical protein B5F36_11690 [Anaerofilum sp. An201]
MAQILDVSKYQPTIHYTEAAKHIEGAILRCGYTGWGDANECRPDECFEQHYAGFKAAGVPVGAYYYSAADTIAKAREEAEFCKQLLAGKQLELPVYYDLEEPHRMNKLSKEQLTAQAEAWAEVMEAAGYFVGIYANTSWFRTKLDHARLAKKYTLWLADYRAQPDTQLQRDLHQYTSAGQVPGIAGGVDLSRVERPDLLTVVKASGLNGWTKQPDKPSVPDPQPQPGRTYTVQPGDSWYRIAAQQLGSESRVQELLAANGATVATVIHPGQIIRLPGEGAAARTYTVQPGDSWWRIAEQQLGSGSRMYELAAANGRTTADTIHPGQVLVLPG